MILDTLIWFEDLLIAHLIESLRIFICFYNNYLKLEQRRNEFQVLMTTLLQLKQLLVEGI